MCTLLEVVDVVIGDAPPLRMSISRGEVLVLAHPPGADVAPLLRALAGVDAPQAGVVRTARDARVVLASSNDTDALSARPDLLVVSATDDASELWRLVIRAKDLGVSVLASSSCLPAREVGARVILDLWNQAELRGELARVRARIHRGATDLLDLLDDKSTGEIVVAATELRALNETAHLLLEELLRRAETPENQQVVRMLGKEVASESLHDRVLDSIISRSGR
jgi:hypothetical protein